MTGRYGGTTFVRPAKFTARRTRPVKVRAVICPTCSAEVDAPCVNLETGLPVNNHRARYVMAVRLENEQREQEA